MASQVLSYFHLHLVSDATGDTLSVMARAVVARYTSIRSLEHVHGGVRTISDITRVLREVETNPGIVLHTIINQELVAELENRCQRLFVPCVGVLDPLMAVMDSYLGEPQSPSVGAQYSLNEDYFRRIEAVNFTIEHDDGQNLENIDKADIVLIGASRTSKTPTSIYLANRGYKIANVPIINELPVPKILQEPQQLQDSFVVGLIGSPDRISHVREKRAETIPGMDLERYMDREVIASEIATTRKLCLENDWPLIDVTRRSIEETAAALLDIYRNR